MDVGEQREQDAGAAKFEDDAFFDMLSNTVVLGFDPGTHFQMVNKNFLLWLLKILKIRVIKLMSL
ncbi:MAG: hypothetical protein R3E90_04495 [Marinicella sp.]